VPLHAAAVEGQQQKRHDCLGGDLLHLRRLLAVHAFGAQHRREIPTKSEIISCSCILI
jgi:hypothetical protein